MNKPRFNLFYFFMVLFAFFQFPWHKVSAQNLQQTKTAEEVPQELPLLLVKEKIQDIVLKEQDPGEYEILTTGSDPYLFTGKLKEEVSSDHHILSFEYFCPSWLDHMQVFFAPPVDENNSIHTELGVSEGWTTFSIDVQEQMDGWGKKGDFLRFDFGSAPNYRMQIRNIRFRKPTDKELEIAANRDRDKRLDAQMAVKLDDYLNEKYSAAVKNVTVKNEQVIIKGTIPDGEGDFYLAEVPLYQDIHTKDSFDHTFPLSSGEKDFLLSIDRFIPAGDKNYDRLFSKWAVVQKSEKGFKLISHARYPDDITAKYNQLKDEKPWNKKGIGGFHAGGNAPVSDLDSLDISSVTVNIWITKFIHSSPSENTMPYELNGKTYYINKRAVENLDRTLQVAADRNIIASAIILIGKASNVADKEIGRIFQHPNFNPAGIYSMANVTSAEGLEYYAAIIDFLAQRYSRPDKKYGRLHHWIIHNEVDAGWVWTNMGEKPPLLFMDDYHKSMRTIYNIAQKYNPHSKVFISLTHYWNWTSDRHFYHPKELLDILLNFSKAEGDFNWAIAQHPYPESLFEPKSWLDKKVDFTFNTPLITYKNIEVLNAWVEQPETLYLGKHKRVIHLSEQGTNSMDYSDQSLKEQAAGMAYAWKKMKDLENIEAFQYHNWMDHRGEGGLRIGLRRFPDAEEDPAGKKPVWYVFRDMGTEREDESFEFAKEIIGIENWDEVIYKGEIIPEKKGQSFRDQKSDTWEATDALGRSLPGYEEVGPLKKDRHVGMFYFLTANNPGKEGPNDVTKLLAADPANPKFAGGAHYWGEPESGYYLSTDEWVIRQHARLLSDAGVDVIIFDCTNNVTYPEVTKTIFEVFREMRSVGEKTPDIAFLASEESAYQIWDQIYSKGRYADLWFQWKDKPLLLFGQWKGIKPMNEVEFPSHIKNFFSLRRSWAWTTLPWYKNEGKDMWLWIDHYPQSIGWHETKDKAEYVPVAVAQHPLSNIGRSFHNGSQPTTDEYDLTPFTGEGSHFAEQWEHALEVDPEFVFVTGWNEWMAGAMVMNEDIEKSLEVWDFYPEAKLGKVGKPLKPGDVYFIDQYNQEYSRDIEPMKGGHSDNYYYQLMANIRKYKGVREPEKGSPTTIDINGSFDQWKNAGLSFPDHIHDTEHRNSPGNYKAGPYINTTGRNDIAESKVTHDQENIYFYIETRDDLTPYKDDNWMLVFIDADQDKSSGWEGYDYVINSSVINESTTTIKRLRGNGKTRRTVKIPMKVRGNKLMISVPRKILNEDGKVKINFHIADNIGEIGDITAFFSRGDSAPSRRANFFYEAK
jgi:hypothetical protein